VEALYLGYKKYAMVDAWRRRKVKALGLFDMVFAFLVTDFTTTPDRQTYRQTD
jgi:hypothetical protein